MKTRIKVLYGLLFSLFACFLFIGYAALTDNLSITGDISGDAQKDVFVTDITVDNSEISNVKINSFYDQTIYQNITIPENGETYYIVKLYNNSTDKWFYDGHEFSEELPSGVSIVVEELTDYNDTTITTTNVISSLIDGASYDYFKITFNNDNSETINLDYDLTLNYTKLENQIKIEFDYNGETYIKYSDPIDSTHYNSVIFDQITIDLSNNTKNLVARCDNGGKLSYDSENNYLKVSNISNYSSVGVGELDIKVKMFDSLTDATMYNLDEFEDDKTPNNFIVLQDINSTIESTTTSIVVNGGRNYSINLNSKNVIIHKTIKNEDTLIIYDDSGDKGKIYREYYVSENLRDLTEKHGVTAIEGCDLIQNIYPKSKLTIENVNLELIQMDETTSRESHREYPAIVVGFEGLVHILNSDLKTNLGYGVYKKSYYAGDYVNRLLNPTDHESKILVESSTITSDRNNCVRFCDGKGIISLVDSTIASCKDISYDTVGWEKTDPIFATRHILEGENNAAMYNEYARFYRYATTDVKIYITGGYVISNTNEHVNHFYSDDELNARVFYTKSAKFMSLNSSNTLEECDIAAKTDDNTNFNNPSYQNETVKYPTAMLNGNGALDSELFNSDGTLNRNHYLNNDGWYYIRRGNTENNSAYNSNTYVNQQISEGAYDFLTHNGQKIRVGDSFELINLNVPGAYYVDAYSYVSRGSDNSTNGVNYPAPMKSIATSDDTQADHVGLEFEFTFLASCDEYYFNIVNLGNLHGTFFIENYNGQSRNEYNVGIKYLDTSLTDVAYMPTMDHEASRFTLMQYEGHQNSSGVYPYVFISKYESVLSYLTVPNDNTFYTANYTITDTSVIRENMQYTNPSYINGSGMYLLSNATKPSYVRNGWYLWQDEVAINLNYDLTNMTGTAQNKFVTLDSNTDIFISKQATITTDGIVLNSNFANDLHCSKCGYVLNSLSSFDAAYNDPSVTTIECKSCSTVNTIDKTKTYNDDDNYGYIRITSNRELYGIKIVLSNDLMNNKDRTNTPWLQLRTYNSQTCTNDLGVEFNQSYIQYDILSATIQKTTSSKAIDMDFGICRPLDSNGNVVYDYDENRLTGTPYYVVFERSDSSTEFILTIYFDAKYAKWDLHSITLDPFDDRAKCNTVTIKSITLIEPLEKKSE